MVIIDRLIHKQICICLKWYKVCSFRMKTFSSTLQKYLYICCLFIKLIINVSAALENELYMFNCYTSQFSKKKKTN